MTIKHRDISIKRESTVWQAVRAVQMFTLGAAYRTNLHDDPGPSDG